MVTSVLAGRRRRWGAVLAVGVLVIAATAHAQPSSVQKPRFQRLEQWLAALAEHVSGTTDETLRAFGSWSVSDWQLLADDAQVLALLSWNRNLSQFWLPRSTAARWTTVSYSRNDLAYLRRLSCILNTGESAPLCNDGAHPTGSLLELQRRVATASARGDANYALHLAALLHTDLAQWGRTRDAVASNPGSQIGGLFLDVTDGRGGGLRSNGLQWVLAYWFLDRTLFTPGAAPFKGVAPTSEKQIVHPDQQDPWVRDWYVSVGFWMQQTGHYDESHLNRGLQLYPGDADLRFLSGCQHEIDAGAEIQSAMKSVRLPAGAGSAIEGRQAELRAAASDFNQALGARPGWAEARIRRAHALLELGELAESERELRFAIASADDDALRYLAAMFLGAIAERSNRLPDASIFYKQAGTLFPTAQSPRFALSQLARRQGNRDQARQELQALFEHDRDQGDVDARNDPWADYLSIHTRHAEARFTALRDPFLRERLP
jgi:tetratricopeptide (TPR) repeat protein